MRFNTLIAVFVATIIPFSSARLYGTCTGKTGVCVYESSCIASGGTPSIGNCPDDPIEIKCCEKVVTTIQGTRTGRCLPTSVCTGNIYKGYCPGD